MVIFADLSFFENTCYQLFKYRANGWQVEVSFQPPKRLDTN